MLAPWKKSYDQPRQHIKNHYFAKKNPSSHIYGLSSSHVWMWQLSIQLAELQRTDAFELLDKTPESPLDCKEIQPVYPKWNQSWIFTGRTDVEGETPILWPSDAKNWLSGKDSDLGKIEGRRIKVWQGMWWLDSITNSMDMSLSNLASW